MLNKSIPHKQLHTTPHTPPSVQLPDGVQDKFLIALNELRQATAPQLADWLGLNVDYVKQIMARLKGKPRESIGFVHVLNADNRSYQARGSMPPVYTLSVWGREYLRGQEMLVHARYKQSELVAKPHTLAVNQVLTKARLLEREHPRIVLSDFRHESWFLQHPLKVPITQAQTLNLSPDLWLDFRGRTSGRSCFLVEVNLREVTEKVWREKVRAYLACIPVYREVFGTGILQVVVICATRENFPKREKQFATQKQALNVRGPQAHERWQRLKNLKRWTEAELREQNATAASHMFLLTDFALDRATATQLYLNDHFLMPFSLYTYSLIRLRKEGHDA